MHFAEFNIWRQLAPTDDLRASWFEVLGEQHFVMWWVPAGHRPTLDEGLARLDLRQRNGDSDDAFGWAHLQQAQRWRTGQCASEAS